MATVPNPRTWTVGELLTASKLNTDLRDGLNFLLSPPLASLIKGNSQSIPNNSTQTVTWVSEEIDRDGGHDNVTNNSRYTAQSAGWYKFTLTQTWNFGTTGIRQSIIRKNNTTNLIVHLYVPIGGGGGASGALSGIAFLAVSDYLEVRAFQDSGSALDLQSTDRWSLLWVSK
ncbi:hypothetical protein AB0I81_23025 [Nonomuraea sp. NPDC050404]|uniref:hypothetical protein n=1 Tax=Nonomuraea sp. NPDC050404 TaxID=3155783 RepID=UPI0033C27FCD